MPKKTKKVVDSSPARMASKLDDLQEKLLMHSESHELDDLPELEDDTSAAGHGQSHGHSNRHSHGGEPCAGHGAGAAAAPAKTGHSQGQVPPAYMQ